MSADAYHMTGMAPEGEGCFRAMNAALKVAGLSPDRIDYVNAHATSNAAGRRPGIQGASKTSSASTPSTTPCSSAPPSP